MLQKCKTESRMTQDQETLDSPGRRDLFAIGLALPVVAAMGPPAAAQSSLRSQSALGRRRLGALEVSSVGLGVQNMTRTYQTTVPYRPEMLNIIRAAYDNGHHHLEIRLEH
jgi:hypothetical protein